MANKKRVLGRGLSALLKNPETDITSKESISASKVAGSVNDIAVSQIEVNPFQPRSDFNQESLQELAASIQQLGIIQPLTVRKLGYDKYQLISGERRFRASILAGLEKIPTYIRIANDQEMLEMALVENIQREQLNAIEVALSYKRLMEECKLTQERMAERIGKKRSTVTNYLRLLKLPPEIQAGLRDGKISMGHARTLVNVSKKETQLNIFHDTIANGFSVRDLEQIVKDFGESGYKRSSRKKIKNLPSFEHQKLANDLSFQLRSEVKIKVNKSGKGKLEIPFKTEEELQAIIKHFENK